MVRKVEVMREAVSEITPDTLEALMELHKQGSITLTIAGDVRVVTVATTQTIAQAHSFFALRLAALTARIAIANHRALGAALAGSLR